MSKFSFLICLFSLCITSLSAQTNDRIIINKKPRTTNTNNQPNKTFPKTNPQTKPTPTNNRNRVQHENIQALENIELRYTAEQIGSNNKHNFYRLKGHIYSNINEPMFCHNRRIVLFQITNWDSGFLNDDLQSIDGYATNHQMQQGGLLYEFGNTLVREFQFDFKVKRGNQPYIKSEIIKDWRPMSDYEPYLLMNYAALSGDWVIENSNEAKFNLQFSPQGEQIVMTDLLKNQIAWNKVDEKNFIRTINVNQTQQPSTTSNSQYPPKNQSSTTTDKTPSGSNYPDGGYLGNGNNNSNNNNSNTNNGNNNNQNNAPSGGYLGNGNENASNTNQNSANLQSYSSLLQIVDRNTLKYQNSEGIICILKRPVK